MSAQSLLLDAESMRVSVPDAERQKALSQWYTPADLATRVWRWTCRDVPHSMPLSVLEPSCGRGALITPLFTLSIPVCRLVAYDIDSENAAHVAAMLAPTGLDFEVHARDFRMHDGETFDLCVQNPPYENNLDVEFAEIALDRCKRVVGIYAVRMLFSQERGAFWKWTDIRRLVVLSSRPRFGGGFTPMTDFCVMELARRQHARKQGEPSAAETEWW